MNPNNSSESFQLPSPVAEQAPEANSEAESPRPPEMAAAPEQAGQAVAPPILPTVPLPEPPAMPAAVVSSGAGAATQDNPAQASDDSDLIEKEWVTKAKRIVERTRHDPYKQSEELTLFKADYMKKRYNKTIKVSK